MSVRDGQKRTPSTDSTVHRELVVVNPPLQGRDIANLQRAVKARLKARGLADDVPTPTHGKFTHATAVACVEAGYFLGLRSDTYLKTATVDGDRRLCCTEGAQTIIRHPARRVELQLDRAKVRAEQLDRGPRYYDELAAKTITPRRSGAQAAIKWALSKVGTTESPPGSNWGGEIAAWIKLAGYVGPVPWCGCFVNAALVAAGQPSGAGWIGYTPAIVARAKAATGGWSWHAPSQGKPGDLALFDTPGGDPAVHVGLVVNQVSATSYNTVEGNTSSGSSGSQDNGGGVFRRARSTGGTFRIIGFARPPWED